MLKVVGVATFPSSLDFTNTTVAGLSTVSGNVDFKSDLNVDGTVNIGGVTNMTGTLNANGEVNLGNATSDTITALGRFDSSIIPATDDLYDLGSASLEFNDLHIDGVAHIDTLDVDENAGVTGNLTVTGNSIFNGNVDLGNASSDSISALGKFDTNLVPNNDNQRDLGTSTLEWRDLFIDGTAHIDTLDVDGNAGVIGNLTVSGTTQLNGHVNIGDATNDTISILSAVDTDFLPDATGNNRDLGSTIQKWKEVHAVSLYGEGSNITTLNASNISSGTINDARLPATITSDITGNAASSDTVDIGTASANQNYFITFTELNGSAKTVNIDSAGDLTYNPSSNTLTTGTFSGSGSGLSSLNASNLSTGTVPDARMNGTYTMNMTGTASQADNINIDESNTAANFQVTFTNTNQTGYQRQYIDTDDGHFLYNPNSATLSGLNISASTLSASDGSGIQALNASNLGSGTVPLARLGSGTKNSSTFLAGDNTFKTVTVAINSISADGDNRIITSDGDGTATAEANLTFDGTTLQVSGTGNNSVQMATGAISATGNITAFASDIRLKTEIKPIENAVAKLLKLNGFTYELNELAGSLGYELNGERYSGVSAQEVKEVLPEAVKPAPINSDYMTVQYEKLVPLLIEAIKELKVEIDELKK